MKHAKDVLRQICFIWKKINQVVLLYCREKPSNIKFTIFTMLSGQCGGDQGVHGSAQCVHGTVQPSSGVSSSCNMKPPLSGTAEKAPQLRARTALAGDPSSFPSIHTGPLTNWDSSFRRTNTLFWLISMRHQHAWHSFTQTQHINEHKNKPLKNYIH